jgi:hypothetical protein
MATTISKGSSGEPFYIFQQLKEAGVVFRTIELKADCDICGGKGTALYTSRISPVAESYVGHKDKYRATCE